MSDDARPPNTTARAPFDDVDADVILHTSDHVDFRVFRLILTLSSPFFQGMFSLPQPADPQTRPTASTSANTSMSPLDAKHARTSDADANAIPGGVTSPSPSPSPPSIDVPEDSHTLDTLLRFLYPNTHPAPFRDLQHARNVALAASKYVMSTALDTIADRIQTEYAATHPMQVYLVACRMGWEGVAKTAARWCLDPGLMPGADLDPHDFDLLHYPGAGVAYHRLETYREACRSALERKLDDMDLFDEDGESLDCEEDDSGDEGVEGISERCLTRWTAQYWTNIKRTVLKCPRREKLDDFFLSPDGNCRRCNIYRVPNIATARMEVASRIDDVLSEVELRFGP